MPRDIKPYFQATSALVHKSGRLIEDKMIKASIQRKKKQKITGKLSSRKAGKVFAKSLGIDSINDQEDTIKQILNLQIILLHKQSKLTHQQLASIVRASRPKITRVLNGNLRGVSIEFLLRTLSSFGTTVRLHFETTS